jgi:hypothetical protein
MTEFLLGSDHTLLEYSNFLQRLFNHLRDRDGNERNISREIIVQTCRKHIGKPYTDNCSKDYFMGPTAIAALRIEDPDLARAALHVVKDSFDTSTFWDLGRLGFGKTEEL